ncbi:uncharacterized protein LOC131008855 [Salvia miltiorrhiza]|uniref:uncharacterized protein LOC131008855 n=1 Tax=Salvia miltiorrhiza TaxID=226208 RepID=UPI0025AC20A4|nr:uncharacterized protein LOC131008855 [Salvia miltiorrhiza]
MASLSPFPQVSNNYVSCHVLPGSRPSPTASVVSPVDASPLRLGGPTSAMPPLEQFIGKGQSKAQQSSRSFADTLKQTKGSRQADVPAYDYTVLQPSLVNDKPCLIISEGFHQRQVRSFSHALHGRIILRKGDRPHFAADLHVELQQLWKPDLSWEIIPLGKGYFTLKFSSAQDMALAFAKNTWKLRPGILHLQTWVPNFDPYKDSSTKAQVWIRVFNLPHEYWHPEVLSGIARHVGAPIVIDGLSAHASVGHFARILVEMDVSKAVPDFFDVKCGDRVFVLEFGYEDLPYYCHSCCVVGHATTSCRRSKEGMNDTEGQPAGKGTDPAPVQQHRSK